MEQLVYKLRHNPTGLFYQPIKGGWNCSKSNLSKHGKIYTSKAYISKPVVIGVSDAQIKKYNLVILKNIFNARYDVDKEDWEIVEYKLIKNE